MRGAGVQLAVVLLAGALWSIYPQANTLSLLAAYGGAWLLLGVARAVAPDLFRVELTRVQLGLLTVTLALPPLVRAADLRRQFLRNEHLDGLGHQLDARWRLEDTPSIFPAMLSADRPQTFYLHAPGATEVSVRVGGAQLDAVSLGQGLFRLDVEPRRLALPERAGRIRAVLLVDGETHRRELRFERRLPHPRWLHPSSDGRSFVTVSEETDTAYVFDRDAHFRVLETADGPVDAWFEPAPSGEPADVVIAHRYSSELWFRGARDAQVEIGLSAVRVAVGGETIVIARAGSEPELVIVRQRRVRRRIPLGFVPDQLAVTAQHIVVSSLIPAALHRYPIRGGEAERAPQPLQLGRPAVTMAAAGELVTVAVTDLQTSGPPHTGNHFVREQLVEVDVPRWRITHAVLTADRTARQGAPGDTDRGAGALGIHLTPDGSTWVAFSGTDDIARYSPDLPEPARFLMDDHPLGAPVSVVALDGGRFAVSSATFGVVAVFSRRGERMGLARLAPHDQELLHDDQHGLQLRIGERYFYEATRSGVSCQSCHPAEGSDGGRHNIGDKTLISTLDTRGLFGTPPYLRDGGYALLGGFDDLVNDLYRGFLRPQSGRRPSLAAYLESLPRPTPYHQLEGRDTARERRGVRAFVRARCTVCHTFPAFTNLGQHPARLIFGAEGEAVGSLELDVPTLLGVGQSAPFLLDGRADTLRSVLMEHDPVHRHGDVRALDEGQLADLIYFLESL